MRHERPLSKTDYIRGIEVFLNFIPATSLESYAV